MPLVLSIVLFTETICDVPVKFLAESLTKVLVPLSQLNMKEDNTSSSVRVILICIASSFVGYVSFVVFDCKAAFALDILNETVSVFTFKPPVTGSMTII